MKVRKRADIILEAVELLRDGEIMTDNGIMKFKGGDMLLSSSNGEQWPVSREYFEWNYEVVESE